MGTVHAEVAAGNYKLFAIMPLPCAVIFTVDLLFVASDLSWWGVLRRVVTVALSLALAARFYVEVRRNRQSAPDGPTPAESGGTCT